jgi:hypothetical protein
MLAGPRHKNDLTLTSPGGFTHHTQINISFMVGVKRFIKVDNKVQYVYMRGNQRFVNSAGILEFNTWRYYINNKGCFSFKGKGIEDNYYLLRPINLLDGTQVKSRKLFWRANAEAELIWGTDYIIGSHQHRYLVFTLFSKRNLPSKFN